MPTKRKKSVLVANAGIRYVNDVVTEDNSIFQRIDLENDIGNDAYIEFIDKETATGTCIAVQIKSGDSYISSNKQHLEFRTDKEHFEYWNQHILPVAAIIYNPSSDTAAWVDIKAILRANPNLIDRGPYVIRACNSFNTKKFGEFKQHFIDFRSEYISDANFGLSIKIFADIEKTADCSDAIRSLFAFHRNRIETWYYFITCFRNFKSSPLLRYLLFIIGHLGMNPDMFWHKDNFIDYEVQRKARGFISSYMDREEVSLMLNEIGEEGIARGTFGQAIHSIIDNIEEINYILYEIAFDFNSKLDVSVWALVLLIYNKQFDDVGLCFEYLDRYIDMFPRNEKIDWIREIRAVMKEYGCIDFY